MQERLFAAFSFPKPVNGDTLSNTAAMDGATAIAAETPIKKKRAKKNEESTAKKVKSKGSKK